MRLDEATQRLELVLRLKVSGMTLSQVVRFFNGDAALAARVVRALERRGLVHSSLFAVRALPSPARPIFRSWEGGATPAELERLLRRREDAPLVTERLFFIGEEFRRPGHINHEVGLAEVFLKYKDAPGGIEWIGEREIYPRRRPFGSDVIIRVPDAVIVTPAGNFAVDFSGTYRAGKLSEIIKYYASNSAYVGGVELW
jgi:hypothetical protein